MVTQPADWGQRFQQLSADAAQMYARTLRRYNELLARVARGEMQPEQVQAQFREYLQEQAATSTREMVELSVGLLTGLLHIEARYRDGLLDGLLPPEGPPPPPPSPEHIDLTNWFQSLATYASEQSARSMARHQQLVERVASGEIPPSRVQEEGRRFLEARAPEFLADVMNLGLTFVGRLQRSSAAMADGLYDRVLGPDADREARPEPPICVDLRGAPGSSPAATIVVENTRGEAADVVCHVSEFASRDGGRRFVPSLEVTPARFNLAPGSQRDVEMRLLLDPALFAAATDYVATLLVSGAGDREIVVQIIARADDAPAPEPSPAPDDDARAAVPAAPVRPARKRR
jgi:hypothetical protein